MKLLTYQQAAARAGVSVRQIRRWRAAGLEGHIHPESGAWLVEEDRLMATARAYRFRRSRFSETVQPDRSKSASR